MTGEVNFPEWTKSLERIANSLEQLVLLMTELMEESKPKGLK